MKPYLKRVITYFSLLLISIFLITAGMHHTPRVNASDLPQREYVYQVPEKIVGGLATASLSEEGVDPENINELMLAITDKKYKNIHSVLLVKNGRLILEEYFYGYNREKLHQIRSATKSIGSVLTGIAIDKGFIIDTNEKIYPYFKSYEPEQKWDERVKDVKLRHLLTMTSGYDCDDHKNNFKCEINMEKSDDWVEYALNLPMANQPGKHWAYNSASLWLVGEMISKTSNMTIPDFADKYLFDPLGITDFQWGLSPNGKAWLAGNAKMTPRGMAKFGYMVLNRGRWGKKQIVSREWIRESVEKHAVSRVGWGYGYLWWTGESIINNQVIKAFWAAGNGGNYIFILPSLDMVTVFTGGNYSNILEVQVFGMLINYLIPAVLPSLPRKFIKLDDMLLEGYVGKYKTTTGGFILSVYRQADKLYVQTPYEKQIEILPETESQFYGTSQLLGDLLINFSKSENGNVEPMIIQLAFMKLQADKIE